VNEPRIIGRVQSSEDHGVGVVVMVVMDDAVILVDAVERDGETVSRAVVPMGKEDALRLAVLLTKAADRLPEE
jgi:pyrimidine operon attenuation protein/uracil phosphoribosyltransferase